jgi:ATP-dependent DNA helicase RecQ
MSAPGDQSLHAQAALQEHFGHTEFRHGQEEIVQAITSGKQALVIMPTGGGKSLCYQLPALLMEGTAIIVSPLISLMQDQVDALSKKGIPATYINSTLSPKAQHERIQALQAGAYKLVYIAPERFRQQAFTAALDRTPISLFAIDEAHCISQWGHDFRPDYLHLGRAIHKIGHKRIAAFTATATPEVREDICKNLGLESPLTFVTGFARKNLQFRVTRLKKDIEKYKRIRLLIEQHETGIIYCATRKQVEAVAQQLESWGVAYVAYHGGMNDEARKKAQEAFMEQRADIAVATNAFGMGIDRPNVRFVAHFQLPGSLEAYYQEAGRAGRDGQESVCELLYSYRDKRVQEFFIDGNNPNKSFILLIYRHLLDISDTRNESHLSIEALTERLGKGTNPMAVGSALSILNRLQIIERFDVAGQRSRGTRLLHPNKLPQDLPLQEEKLREKELRDRSKLESVIRYAESKGCRQTTILHYFGETDARPCNRCDRCISPASGIINPPTNLSSKNLEKSALRIPTDEELVLVQKVLSGIARMSLRDAEGKWLPRFGKTRIVDMLRGSRSADILEGNLDKLSTYSLLKQESKNYLITLLEELEKAGLVETVRRDTYDLITLTHEGTLAMKGQLRYRLCWPLRKGHFTDTQASLKTAIPVEIPEGYDETLYQKLQERRNAIARETGVPAYAILPNRPLRHLAAAKPTTLKAASEIPGIGPVKIKTVVPALIGIIQEHR